MRVRNAITKSSETGENLVSGLGPDERFGLLVIEVEVLTDGMLQLHGAAMRAAFDLTLAQGGEPALDLVEPRARGLGEMDMKARMARQPGRTVCVL